MSDLPISKLYDYYNVDTETDLIIQMLNHIERLKLTIKDLELDLNNKERNHEQE